MKALANYQDFSYADMEDIALILKGIAVHVGAAGSDAA